MESKATRYHLEINGVAEGPMTARELAAKIGAASGDDVILFRKDGSGDWLPLDGHVDEIRQFADEEAASEQAVVAPPKLKLKKNGGTPPPFPTATPPAYPTEYPPPPPGAPAGTPFVPDPAQAMNQPPPPPGAPQAPVPQLSMGTHSSQPSQAGNGAPYMPPPPGAPSAPTHPPAKLSSVLVASLVISLAIVTYIFFFMKQEVSGSATRATDTAGIRPLRDLRYSVLTKEDAEEWKAKALERLNAFGNKAKTEAAASETRTAALAEKAAEVVAKYEASSRSLLQVGVNANFMGMSTNPKSEIKAQLTLEAAMEVSAPYLKPATWADMQGERFRSVLLAVSMESFPGLSAAFEREILEIESLLKNEQALIRPLADEAGGITSTTLYAVPSDVSVVSTGKTDSLGLFWPELAPGEYYLIARAERVVESKPTEWALAFTVNPMAENNLKLQEENLGTAAVPSLWKAAETQATERDIEAIRAQAQRIGDIIDKIRDTRRNIQHRRDELNRLQGN